MVTPTPSGSNTISIHAPREGGDCFAMTKTRKYLLFQSTPPARGATLFARVSSDCYGYFNPRPREGGDPQGKLSVSSPKSYFNPRPPRGGRRKPLRKCHKITSHFNPRPPRGGRLLLLLLASGSRTFQSTPPARGATLRNHNKVYLEKISIHAPREGGDD